MGKQIGEVCILQFLRWLSISFDSERIQHFSSWEIGDTSNDNWRKQTQAASWNVLDEGLINCDDAEAMFLWIIECYDDKKQY